MSQALIKKANIFLSYTPISCGVKFVYTQGNEIDKLTDDEVRELWEYLRGGVIKTQTDWGQELSYAYLIGELPKFKPLIDKVKPRYGYRIAGDLVIIYSSKKPSSSHYYKTLTDRYVKERE